MVLQSLFINFAVDPPPKGAKKENLMESEKRNRRGENIPMVRSLFTGA
jgi:hypothetical protein